MSCRRSRFCGLNGNVSPNRAFVEGYNQACRDSARASLAFIRNTDSCNNGFNNNCNNGALGFNGPDSGVNFDGQPFTSFDAEVNGFNNGGCGCF